MQNPTPSNLAGLYIHVPFCGSICNYCDFNRWLPHEDQLQLFSELVLKEFNLRSNFFAGFKTLFFGGGTPSFLPLKSWDNLLTQLIPALPQLFEFSIEANPNQLSLDKLKLWKSFGLTRLSLGVQSFDTDTLLLLGRTHTNDQVYYWVNQAEKLGIDLSIDLMFGLPGQSLTQWINTLDKALALPLSHLSFYGLTVEPHTVFDLRKQRGELPSLPEEYDQMYLEGVQRVEKKGMLRYETSNFSLPGKECIHNQNYWNHTPYLGLGPGAHSYHTLTRSAGPKKWQAWFDWLHQGCPILEENKETLTHEVFLEEKLWLGLRQKRGCSWNLFPPLARKKMTQAMLQKWPDFFIWDNENFALKERGWLYIDQLTIDLLEYLNTK